MKSIALLLVLTLLLLVTACPRETSVSAGDVAVNLSRQDLSQRMNFTPEEILVISVDEDAPNTLDLKATVYIVVLEARGNRYEYHTIEKDKVVLYETTTFMPLAETKYMTRPTATTKQGSQPEDFCIPLETTGIMDGKPWMPVN